MKPKNLFFAFFSATILLTRILLFFLPLQSPTISGFRTHHWMYGLAITVLIVLIYYSLSAERKKQLHPTALASYGIGAGLLMDEFTFMLIGGTTHAENYSAVSLLGTAVLMVLVYGIREKMVGLLK